jgi:hypothetical protein
MTQLIMAMRAVGVIAAVVVLLSVHVAAAGPTSWRAEWPRTDFAKHTVPFAGGFRAIIGA